jgi:N-acetylglucosamine kinase-like BadF-type ATPase
MQIIAESGGTKTDWRFIYASGRIEQFVSSGLNPTYIAQDELIRLLENELTVTLEEAVTAIYFYGAGCQTEEAKAKICNVLSSFFPACDTIVVNHDLLAAARACSKDKAGIVCILGTGSNACLYDGRRITRQVTNLGFILGDEGSGAYMGKQLVKDYFNNRLPEELHTLFNKQFPSLTKDVLLEQLYRKPKPNKFLAQFFPFILAHQSISYCQELMVEAFESFLQNVQATFFEADHLPIHFVGGVAFHGNPILRRVLQRKQLNTGIIIESPIAGLTLYHQNNIS